MSLKTWMEEFYPIEAHDVAANPYVPEVEFNIDLVNHSLTKWTGLKPENIKKHNLEYGDYWILEQGTLSPRFYVDSESCALCAAYDDCKNCPLQHQLPPDLQEERFGCEHEFQQYRDHHDPEPMINLLQTTLKTLQQTS